MSHFEQTSLDKCLTYNEPTSAGPRTFDELSIRYISRASSRTGEVTEVKHRRVGGAPRPPLIPPPGSIAAEFNDRVTKGVVPAVTFLPK